MLLLKLEKELCLYKMSGCRLQTKSFTNLHFLLI